MNDDVEEALRRTFARAQARIPATPPDLLHRVTVRPAPRGRRALVLAAAAATALVAGAASAVAWQLREPQPAATPYPAVTAEPTPSVPGRRTVPEIAPPLEQVLPAAVAEVPRQAPNGKAFTPKAIIDSRTVLGYVAKKGYDPAPELWAYRWERRTFRHLATIDAPIAPVDSPVVGEGVIVWFKYVNRDIHIMAIPVTGGTPRTVVSFPAEREVDKVNGDTVYGVDLAIANSKVFWSSVKSGGVHQAPLSGGGEPSPVPGTEGLRLFRWPWAGRFVEEDRRGWTELRNLKTGERLTDPISVRCDVTWCLSGDQAIRHDGSRVVHLPGRTAGPLVADRFVVLDQTDDQGRQARAIFDLTTSQVGRLGTQADPKSPYAFHTTAEMLYFARGDKWVVIHDPDR